VSDFPRSLIEFHQRFPDEEASAKYLFAARWPQGFVCPSCGTSKAWGCKPNGGHGNAPAAA
jgi:Transposase zinc-ribbon domain